MTSTNANARSATRAMAEGRRADSARHCERVLPALRAAINNGDQVSHHAPPEPGRRSPEPPCRPSCSANRLARVRARRPPTSTSSNNRS